MRISSASSGAIRFIPIAAFFILAAPLAAQDNALFPTFALSAGVQHAELDTLARVDPRDGGEGTTISFEDDLGLPDSETVERFSIGWRPARRHELSATFFATSRHSALQIDREIVFRDEIYPVRAFVSTDFAIDFWSASYTFWAIRRDNAGLGITLGIADLAIDAAVTAQQGSSTVTVTETAKTDVPVALGGVEGRVGVGPLHASVRGSALPRVTIEEYTGRAIDARAAVEYRPMRWFGIGAAYHYFDLDVDIAQTDDLRGIVEMTIEGPEAYLRFGF